MIISSYTDLISAAKSQEDLQKLLFVFTQADLPEDADTQQKENFLTGCGGALSPVMYVDKFPNEVEDFSTLIKQSREMKAAWEIVFVGALSGEGSVPPGMERIEKSFFKMIEDIKRGKFGSLIAFDCNGDIVSFI
jgi:hypothetical protein